MNNYLTHLIADIDQILARLPEPPSALWDSVNIDDPGEIEDMSYIEQFVEGQEQELHDIVGIKREVLPPPERLTDIQISRLLPKLHDLLEYHHFEPDYPCELDERTKYELLYEIWDSDQVKMTYGVVHLEFCSYDEDYCPIPGQCNGCEQIRLEMENDYKGNSEVVITPENLLPTHEEIERFVAQQKAREAQEIIESLKPNQENITGIFNYCNRWCENCSFTNRCTNYQLEAELGLHDTDFNQDKLFESLHEVLSGTLNILKAKAASMDIDLEQFENADQEELDAEAEHPLVIQATKYMMLVSKWFNNNSNYLSDISSVLYNSSQKNFKELNHQLDTIDWHRTMIPVKLNRALQSFDNSPDDEYDRNLTGKLVLECLQSSMDSFTFLLGKLSKKEDEILGFLAMLSQLKTGLEKELPNAKNAIRPGLDED